MALPSASEKIIQQGHSCNVVVYDEDNNAQTLALVQSASYNEDFGVVPAQCLGVYGPVSLDAQNYTCNLTLNTFVPLNPREEITVPYLDGGTQTMQTLLKTRSEVAITGKGTVLSQIDFIDKQEGVVYNSFSQCVITSNNGNISPGSYVTGAMNLSCIERTL
ncbi:MAG: hypothetical protein PQJ59_16530 [Spirochaetales bacterium]|nr:hypothetical protein [Spirochaetales bacterium]